MSVRVLLADDHPVVLSGLRALLDHEPDMQVVRVCRDGAEVVEAALADPPDVVVLDQAMPRCTGLEAVVRVRRQLPDLPAVLLTATLDDEALLATLRARVEGVLLKETAPEALVETVRGVAAGERRFPQPLLERALRLAAAEKHEEEGFAALTPRERAVATRIADGWSNKAIASELGISEGTVKSYVHEAFRKLRVTNRVQLALRVHGRR